MVCAILLVIMSLIALTSAQSSRVLTQNDGTNLQCDHDNPCPSGYTCMISPSSPTIRECYSGIRDSRVRAGRCPLANEPQTPCPPLQCTFDQDCPASTDRCCSSRACGRVCRPAISIDPAPKVTLLMNGTSVPIGPPAKPTGFQFYSATVLVQSGGKNVQWESGMGQVLKIVKALNDFAGIRTSDLHMLIASHGHPDHSGNAGVYVDIPTMVGTGPFTITGSEYIAGPLASADRIFLFDDRNLELVSTPGHMQHDFSLIVHNVQGMGNVALVGDLYFDKNDGKNWMGENQELGWKSRRAIMCTYGANYIVPGHGDMFQVTEATKLSTGINCNSAGKRAAGKVGVLVLLSCFCLVVKIFL